jgi:hypothetical protein
VAVSSCAAICSATAARCPGGGVSYSMALTLKPRRSGIRSMSNASVPDASKAAMRRFTREILSILVDERPCAGATLRRRTQISKVLRHKICRVLASNSWCGTLTGNRSLAQLGRFLVWEEADEPL